MIHVWHCPPVMPGVESVGKVIFVNLVSIKSNTYQSGNGPNKSFCTDSVDDKSPQKKVSHAIH
jgi:hypothetical protein